MDSLKDLAGKAVAVIVLLLVAYLIFKVVLGVVAGILWTAIIVMALVAAVWALNKIL
jgi:uncharacterized membrane protein YGL010W